MGAKKSRNYKGLNFVVGSWQQEATTKTSIANKQISGWTREYNSSRHLRRVGEAKEGLNLAGLLPEHEATPRSTRDILPSQSRDRDPFYGQERYQNVQRYVQA